MLHPQPRRAWKQLAKDLAQHLAAMRLKQPFAKGVRMVHAQKRLSQISFKECPYCRITDVCSPLKLPRRQIRLTAEAEIAIVGYCCKPSYLEHLGEKPQIWEVCSEIAAVFRRQRCRLRSRMSGYQEIRQDRLSRSTFIAIVAVKPSCEVVEVLP